MRILAVTHGPQVRAELFGEVILARGHELDEWEIHSAEAGAADRPPGSHDAVIVLGGDQNVGEEDRHPWLHDEYELLRGWVADGTPLLGICLGAQTLAHAFGGRVARLPEQCLGLKEVVLTPEGGRDPVLGALPSRFEALFGNAYGFTVPDGGVDLADLAGRSQAFRLGAAAWAVQFHPEARRAQVVDWARADGEPEETVDRLDTELAAGIARWHELGATLCAAFLAEAARLQATGPA